MLCSRRRVGPNRTDNSVNQPIPEWKQFELAVAGFVTAIGHGAKVTHDIEIPDSHTGYPRQRDVWVEWDFAGHFPAKALISCKNLAKSLDQQDIDHFNGEYISSQAHIGIIYAKAGFNDRAIEKSRKLGFHCCKLYRNEPAELPEGLVLGLCYHFRPQCRFSIHSSGGPFEFKSWREVFQLRAEDISVFDFFVQALDAYQVGSDPKKRWKNACFGQSISIETQGKNGVRLVIKMEIRDQAFQAKVEYTMLDGSYNLTSGRFLGSEITPSVDLRGEHPGPGWSELQSIPESLPKKILASFAGIDGRIVLTDFAKQGFGGMAL
jgi:hypothetical protein